MYRNLGFLTPLVESMMQRDPKARPTAPQALWQFENIISQQRGSTLRWHLIKGDEPVSRRVSQDIKSTAREIFVILRNVAGKLESIQTLQSGTELWLTDGQLGIPIIASPYLFATVLIAAPASLLSTLLGRHSFFDRLRNVFHRSPTSISRPIPWASWLSMSCSVICNSVSIWSLDPCMLSMFCLSDTHRSRCFFISRDIPLLCILLSTRHD